MPTGGATVRAVRLTAPLRVDGRLDEADLRQRCRRSATSSSRSPSRGAPGDGEDRGLAAVRRRRVLRHVPLWESRPERTGGQRDAARQQQHLPERPHRVPARHLLRPAQRHRVRDQPARRPLRRPDLQRAQFNARLEPDLGVSRSAGSRAAGRSRPPSRSSRCATGRAARRSGASTPAGEPGKNETSFLTRVPRAAGAGGPLPARRSPRRWSARGAAGIAEPRGQAVRGVERARAI